MPLVYLDDGYPEACEYADNYIYFDAGNAKSVRNAFHERDRAAYQATINPMRLLPGLCRFFGLNPSAKN